MRFLLVVLASLVLVMNVQDNKSYYSCVSYWVSGYGWQLTGCSSTYVAP